jgi:two-component system, NtrC family, response regulator AtoC
MSTKNIPLHALIIDDEPQVRSFISHVLSSEGWEVSEAESAERAFEMLHEKDWSLVLCDVLLGGESGFSVLKRFREELPEKQVVLMTGRGSALDALDATALGAFDYLLKPFGIDELQSLMRAARERFAQRSARRSDSRKKDGASNSTDIELVGRSEAFIEVMKQVGRVAATNLPVLVTGESGTGKEVVARALHRRSRRVQSPFVAVNCGAIPAELIESELFGHVKGAFTGAHADRAGLFEEADGGTVFLDEITETTPVFQVKLLRALQEGEIRRVGSNRTQRIDVRVVTASNRDVEREVDAGRFRQDLFYRLNAVTLHLPPLRERREDIMPLARHFAGRVWSANPAATFSPEASLLLEQYPWPGNVRELENAVVRAVALCGNVVRPEDLPDRVRNYQTPQQQEVAPAETHLPQTGEEWPTLAEIEGHYVGRVLAHTGGNKQAAARILGVDRKTLERMIKRNKLDPKSGQPARSQTN